MATESIICIHCKRHRPSSQEHAIGSSIGGNQTAPLLCTPCNTHGSKLDQALAERSLVALSRASNTPPDAFKTKLGWDVFYHDESLGLTFEYTIRSGFRPEPYPQVHLCLSRTDPNKLEFGVSAKHENDLRRLDSFIKSVIAKGQLRKIHVKEGPPNAGDTPRLVLHRSKDAFVRVPKGGRSEAEKLFGHLEKEWEGTVDAQLAEAGLPTQVVENPKMTISISLCLNDIYRAVAKLAFNVMAIRFGADFALRQEFDEIRDYIVGKDVRDPEPLQKDQIAVDSRFVEQPTEYGTPFMATENHTVLLTTHGRSLFAHVTLYGFHEYLVRLGDILMDDFVFSVIEYSITRDWHRELSIDEIYHRVVSARRTEASRATGR